MMHGFEKAGLQVVVTVYEGKAVQVMYSKLKKDALGRPEPLSTTEIKTLLDANGQGEAWDKAVSELVAPNTEGWLAKLKTGLVIATHNKQSQTLSIITKDFNSLVAGGSKKEERQALEGF